MSGTGRYVVACQTFVVAGSSRGLCSLSLEDSAPCDRKNEHLPKFRIATRSTRLSGCGGFVDLLTQTGPKACLKRDNVHI